MYVFFYSGKTPITVFTRLQGFISIASYFRWYIDLFSIYVNHILNISSKRIKIHPCRSRVVRVCLTNYFGLRIFHRLECYRRSQFLNHCIPLECHAPVLWTIKGFFSYISIYIMQFSQTINQCNISITL